MKKNEKRSGSALVIVLGMTAVLMMMAVAFSVLMRTERSGMTNLKHALTARQTTHTALARVMTAIDQSFEHPTNSWPIATWEQPYISSWERNVTGTQHWQCASIDRKDESPENLETLRRNARILTDELSWHLSPSQLALAKNAKIDWVTVRSGVGASKATTQQGPIHDMIIARYAFLALHTTGLLDMNIGPMTNATDVANQQAIDGTDFISFLKKRGKSAFIKHRNDFRKFSSYAEMWRALMGNKRYNCEQDLETDDIITPDLFNTFSMSLDEVDPNGKMKLFIPKDTSASAFNDADKKAYAKLALARFEKIFAEETPKVKLAGTPLPELTRAQLATQALIDYIDEDDIPSGGIWGNNANPLNYPCTEAVPMVASAFAEIKISDPVDHNNIDVPPQDWYREWEVTLTVYCEAHDFSREARADEFQFEVEYKLANLENVSSKLWAPFTEWEVSFIEARQAAEFEVGSMTGSKRGSRNEVLGAPDRKTFTVKTKVKEGTVQYVDGVPVPGSEKYREFSKYHEAHEHGTAPAKGYDTLRVNVDIRAMIKKGGTVIQAVPAPALGDSYRLRVAPVIYHNQVHEDDSRENNEIGWAYCIDPRFAYNTLSMHQYPGDGVVAWLSNEMCSLGSVVGSIYGRGGEPYETVWKLADKLREWEASKANWEGLLLRDGEERGTYLIEREIFNKFPSISDSTMLLDVLSGRNKIFPDAYHSEESEGKMFIERGTTIRDLTDIYVANKPMTSLGEFGNLLIGPWETLSLFATFGPGPFHWRKVDFHRISDSFSLTEARFPKISDIPGTGIETLTGADDEYLPAIHLGKLNLNPQLKVKCDDFTAGSGRLPPAPGGNMLANANENPLAVLLATASTEEEGTPALSFAQAKAEADRFYKEVSISGQRKDDPIDMFRFASDVGNVNVTSNLNPILSAVMATGLANTDAQRERFIGDVLDRLTTRGQTYLVIIRADAYSPKYGSVSALGGTTLATEYALVELWRDSEPNRYPDGKYYPDDTDTPEHSWFIRSCRFFSP